MLSPYRRLSLAPTTLESQIRVYLPDGIGFHLVSSGMRLLRSRPQLHCASSTVIPSGSVKKNSWRSWNSLSSPRTWTPWILDPQHSFDILDRKANVIETQPVEPRNAGLLPPRGVDSARPGRGAG